MESSGSDRLCWCSPQCRWCSWGWEGCPCDSSTGTDCSSLGSKGLVRPCRWVRWTAGCHSPHWLRSPCCWWRTSWSRSPTWSAARPRWRRATCWVWPVRGASWTPGSPPLHTRWGPLVLPPASSHRGRCPWWGTGWPPGGRWRPSPPSSWLSSSPPCVATPGTSQSPARVTTYKGQPVNKTNRDFLDLRAH